VTARLPAGFGGLFPSVVPPWVREYDRVIDRAVAGQSPVATGVICVTSLLCRMRKAAFSSPG
jgi:hypothetical protein